MRQKQTKSSRMDTSAVCMLAPVCITRWWTWVLSASNIPLPFFSRKSATRITSMQGMKTRVQEMSSELSR